MKKQQPTEALQVLKAIELPSTKLDLIEQLGLALQNRDAIGLKQILENDDDPDEQWGWKNTEDFISKYIDFCNKMDKKHKGVYVQTVPGHCGYKIKKEKCPYYGTKGLGVSLSAVKNNKLLWRFNLVCSEAGNDKLHIANCQKFVVNPEEVPY